MKNITREEIFFNALQEANMSAEEILDEGDRAAEDYADKGEDLGAEEIMNEEHEN